MAAAITEPHPRRHRLQPQQPHRHASSPADEFDAFMAVVPRDLLVILDEAYIEFVTEPDAVNGPALLARYPNLVVLRTFSKAYGLAGLRVGYALGPVAILDAARAPRRSRSRSRRRRQRRHRLPRRSTRADGARAHDQRTPRRLWQDARRAGLGHPEAPRQLSSGCRPARRPPRSPNGCSPQDSSCALPPGRHPHLDWRGRQAMQKLRRISREIVEDRTRGHAAARRLG